MARRALICISLVLLAGCDRKEDAPPAEQYSVTVAAGMSDRIDTPTRFDLPPELVGKTVRLVDDDSRAVAVQTDPSGQVWFVVDSLAAESTRSYRLEVVEPESASATVRSVVDDGAVTLLVGDDHVLTYHAAPTDLPRPGIDSIFQRGGYIHPVRTPAGVPVTDDYPPDHIHHHGIWAAWTSTEYEGRQPDFWNMGDSTGTVEPIGLDTTWSGRIHAGFRSRHRYVDLTGPEPENVLFETWVVRVFGSDGSERPLRVFDLEIIQVTAGDSVLHLPEYRYGGVGFRGHRQWNGADNAVFLTSEGRDRSDGHATTARWCHIGGRVDGEWAGVAILGHPENFRAPQPMRIHPTEPFFNYAPSQAGDWAISPGERSTSRYRYVVYDGEPNAEQLDRLWNDYAHPPVVTVERE